MMLGCFEAGAAGFASGIGLSCFASARAEMLKMQLIAISDVAVIKMAIFDLMAPHPIGGPCMKGDKKGSNRKLLLLADPSGPMKILRQA